MSTLFKDRKPPSDAEIREYFKILREDPKSRVFAPLAESLIRRGRLEEAEKLCIHGVEKNNHFSDGHLAYARVLFYLFRYIDALQEVKKALALDSSNIEAYLIAAEIFFSRSQNKATSDACMKVLDLDPTNSQALQILKKLNVGNEDSLAEDGRFSTISGTAPSSRWKDQNQGPAMTNPFEQLMDELHADGSKLLENEQPFTALSAGSQVEIPVFDENDEDSENEELTQPTQPSSIYPTIPKLPAHPPTPAPVSQPVCKQHSYTPSEISPISEKTHSRSDQLDDLLAQVPQKLTSQQKSNPKAPAQSIKPSSNDSLPNSSSGLLPGSSQAQPAFSSQSQITSWQRIDAAQSIIDSYRDRIPLPSEGPPPKLSRLANIISSLGFIAIISIVLFLIVYLLSTQTKKIPIHGKRPYKPPATSTIKPLAQNEAAKTVELEAKKTKDKPEIKTAEAVIIKNSDSTQAPKNTPAIRKTTKKTPSKIKKKKAKKKRRKNKRRRHKRPKRRRNGSRRTKK